MNETLALVLALLAGLLLGAIFFGGLWWTIQKSVSSKRLALLFLGSLLLRISVALFGFYIVARGHWQRLLVCLLGFIIARVVVNWLIRPSRENQSRPAAEVSHAP
jgi:F1F0 ATPase subunit 2